MLTRHSHSQSATKGLVFDPLQRHLLRGLVRFESDSKHPNIKGEREIITTATAHITFTSDVSSSVSMVLTLSVHLFVRLTSADYVHARGICVHGWCDALRHCSRGAQIGYE